MGGRAQPETVSRLRVLFRVDADAKIGAGHLMRCLALAAALRDKGAETVFLSNIESAPLRQMVLAGGHALMDCDRRHPDPRDLQSLERAAGAGPKFDWAVLDNYAFDPNYQSAARRMVGKLLVIDDMCQWPRYEADLILNQNAGAEKLEYLTPSESNQLLGHEYVLLRPEFLRSCHDKNPKKLPSKEPTRILITLGGSVPATLAALIVDALCQLKSHRFHARVLTGGTIGDDASWKRLANLGVRSGNVALEPLPFVEDTSEPMSWADLAVTAGGSTCWELAYMGVPAFIVVLSADQDAVAAAMQAADCGLMLGRYPGLKADDVSERIAGTLSQTGKLDEMSKAGIRFIDGLGSARVAATLVQ